MSELFLKLLNMSIAASWLILAVVVLRLLLKKAPKWVNCILWALVAVRLICPFSFESNISLVPERVGNGEAVTEWAGDYLDDVWTIPDTSVYYDAAVTAGREPIYAGDGHYYVVAKNDQLGAPATVGDTVVPVLSVVWLAGMVLLLLYAMISYLRLRRRVSAAMLLRENIWLCDAVESPFILGFFRPRIYLPSNIAEEDMEHVLAHERAHLQRRDHWWKPLGYVLLAVYWFNPLIWVAYLLLCRDIELACDEKVINRPNTDRKAYSEALLACSVKRSAITVCPLAFGEVGVCGRIKSVLNYKKPAFWIILVALVACIAAAVCFLTDPVEQTEVDPFEQSYKVVETTYVDGSYSFVMTPENAPKFRIDGNKNLIEISGERPNRMETYLGVLEETKLTRENFDQWFHPITSETGMWENGLSAEKIRRNNQSAWALTQGNEGRENCRLLLQKNGDLYLTLGLTETDQGEKRIRWLLKLEQTEEISLVGGADGPVDVTIEPVEVISEVDASSPALEDAISHVSNRIATFNESWKTIAPGNRITKGKVTALESVATTAMENIRLDLYRLEYRMLLDGNPAAVEVGGMSHEEIDGEIWLTEWESSGQPYILHYSAMENGRIDWKTICVTSTEKIGMIYAENKDMETQLGLDKYTIAIHKLYEEYLENERINSEEDSSAVAYLDLDSAMTAAIREYYNSVSANGVYMAVHYEILGTEERALIHPVTGRESNLLTVYAVVSDGAFTHDLRMPAGEVWIEPAVITFIGTGEGPYAQMEFWTPESGMLYEQGLRERFPAELVEQVLDVEPYRSEMEAVCRAKAAEYFNTMPGAVQVYHTLDHSVREEAATIAVNYVQKIVDEQNQTYDPANDSVGSFYYSAAKVVGLEQMNTGTAALDHAINLYRLEYRLQPNDLSKVVLAGGMDVEDKWITENGSTGKPFLVVLVDGSSGQDVWSLIGMTNTFELMGKYSTDAMLEKYGGNPYTAAAMEIYTASHTGNAGQVGTVTDAMLAAVGSLMTEKLPATIYKTNGAGQVHPVFGKLNAWNSINGKQSCNGIMGHTYQLVDSIETSDTLIALEFAVDGVEWGLTFYEGTDTLSVFTGGTEYLLQATPKQEDIFLSPLGSLIRRWYDETEYMAMDGYDGKTIVIPDSGQGYLEAAKAWCEAYEGLHLKASSGSKECYTYVSCRVEPAESATEMYREQGEMGENAYGFYAYTVFVPENEQARQWSMAGNTGNYEGGDPNVPKGALEYSRCGYITLEEDGWHGTIVGTGW